ncbi:MAG: MXAN_2562 family outer membrane beta-barrel protein, partial [Myxococcota bacterium]
AGKLEGPMSDVQSTMPEETFCASCLRGDDSGFFPGICGVTGGGSAGVVGVVLAGAALLRRRRVAAATVGLLALGLAPGRAEAAEDDDEGPRTMSVQLRYGPTTIAEPYIQQIYSANAHEMLWFEYGWAARFVEANLGIGFFQELGFLQTADGRVSDEHDMFTIVPLALTLTGRLDLLEEQPIVPFGRIGVDYWLWRENWYVSDPATMDDERVGGKYGWHYGGGLALRLDVLDRRAASRLEATAGINDTFLVAEYRKTNLIHAADQVNLSSSEFTFGLKFDF